MPPVFFRDENGPGINRVHRVVGKMRIDVVVNRCSATFLNVNRLIGVRELHQFVLGLFSANNLVSEQTALSVHDPD